MGITVLGDRIYLMDLIMLLKKKKKEVELSSAQWSGVTPAPGIAYKEDCGECCLAYCCPCCLAKVFWRVTGQGVFYKKEPPCGLTTGSGEWQSVIWCQKCVNNDSEMIIITIITIITIIIIIIIIMWIVYDKDYMSELQIKNRSERDLRSCEVT